MGLTRTENSNRTHTRYNVFRSKVTDMVAVSWLRRGGRWARGENLMAFVWPRCVARFGRENCPVMPEYFNPIDLYFAQGMKAGSIARVSLVGLGGMGLGAHWRESILNTTCCHVSVVALYR